MEFLIGNLIGIFVGVLICVIFRKGKRPSGELVVDFSDPAKDVFRIELFNDLNELYRKKNIVLRVKTIDYAQN